MGSHPNCRSAGSRASATLVFIVAAAASGALAEGPAPNLSAEEILNRLNAQAEAEQRRNGGAQTEGTRGISISDGRSSATGKPAGVAVAPPAAEAAPPVSPAAVRDEPPAVVPPSDRVELRITFETNSSFIRPGAAEELAALCEALRRAPQSWGFNIIGHADAAGSAAHNRRLSEARAREVARHLSRECGVSIDRLAVYGLGNSRLLEGVPPVSEANRRVEVSINRI